MNLPLQRHLLAAAAVAAALFAAVKLASGEMALPLMLGTGAALIVVAYFGWRVEAAALAATLAAYLIGNRGMAQFTPLAELPLFPGELCLAFGGVMLLVRGAFDRQLPIRRDPLNLLVLLWLAIGAGRLVVDVRVHGFLAVRDAATVYYAGYFFLAQEIARDPRSRRLLHLALAVSLAVLPVTFLLWVYFPDVFNRVIVFRGVPLIFYKGDLVATMLAAGVFYFHALAESWRWRWAWAAMVVNLGVALFPTTRAAMLALALVSLLHVHGRRVRFFGVLAGSCLLFAGLSLAQGLFSDRPLHQTLAYRTVEYAVSIFDLRQSDVGRYRSYAEGDLKGRPDDNNAFRLVWWRTIAIETFQTAPVFGQGFGADLASSFLSNYGMAGQTDFSTRSPHSILFTVFGRMGFIGLAVFLGLLAVMLRLTVEALRAGRAKPGGGMTVALWAMAWVIAISACFGVVLEGPMGAIPFWVLLGLAHQAREETA